MRIKPIHRSLFLLLLLLLGACTAEDQTSSSYENYLTHDFPTDTPKPFLPVGSLDGLISHQGIFSPDYQTYYFTVSDVSFNQFTVKQITKNGRKWSRPTDAFFNSKFNEHGLSLSRDGNTLFFSSTRPLAEGSESDTWHLWKMERINEQWSSPVHIDIPNLRDKLTSHPSIAIDGTLYFHSSKPDYSEMGIYAAEPTSDGQYLSAKRLEIPGLDEVEACTPYVDPQERFMLFAIVGESLDLALSKKTESGKWGRMQRLPAIFNTQGQGNPQISPDGKYLFYAVGDFTKGEGNIQWVELATVFQEMNL